MVVSVGDYVQMAGVLKSCPVSSMGLAVLHLCFAVCQQRPHSRERMHSLTQH